MLFKVQLTTRVSQSNLYLCLGIRLKPWFWNFFTFVALTDWRFDWGSEQTSCLCSWIAGAHSHSCVNQLEGNGLFSWRQRTEIRMRMGKDDKTLYIDHEGWEMLRATKSGQTEDLDGHLTEEENSSQAWGATAAVMAEYSWVSNWIFRKKSHEELKSLLLPLPTISSIFKSHINWKLRLILSLPASLMLPPLLNSLEVSWTPCETGHWSTEAGRSWSKRQDQGSLGIVFQIYMVYRKYMARLWELPWPLCLWEGGGSPTLITNFTHITWKLFTNCHERRICKETIHKNCKNYSQKLWWNGPN